MKKLSKKNDADRKWKTIKKHTLLLLQPIGVSIVCTAMWYYLLFRNGIHFPKEDEGPLLAGIFVMLSVAYTITTAATFSAVWDKSHKMVISVLKRDQETFLCYRDERMPIIIYLLILSFSAPLVGITALIQYSTWVTGVTCMATITFVLSIYLVVVIQLQNPHKSPWFMERIPSEWLEIDIDKYFKLEEEEQEEDAVFRRLQGA